MPVLIDIRRRIKSVRNTQQITQAMKTVSTAKFRKAQRILLESRTWWHTLPLFLSEVFFWARKEEHPLLQKREEREVEAVVITSDKGLAGAFNSSLLAEALSLLEKKARQAEVRLVLIGKKAISFFRKHPFRVDRAYSEKTHKLAAEDLKELAQYLARLYVFHKVDSVYVVYNEFKSILSPRITVTKLLPLEIPERSEEQLVLPPDWEPEALTLLDVLLPLYVESQIRHFYFESSAAEQAARMMAMDNATENAEELIKRLTLVLNKARQASITKELLEIMTAVDALAKK
jgi:F-type H+-transporting ATPase subunit gamma